MENRIALVGIIVEDLTQTAEVNQILHDYGNYIIGRMGLPHRERQISIISVIMDAPNNTISSMTGKLGQLKGISIKTVYSKAFP